MRNEDQDALPIILFVTLADHNFKAFLCSSIYKTLWKARIRLTMNYTVGVTSEYATQSRAHRVGEYTHSRSPLQMCLYSWAKLIPTLPYVGMS